MPKGTGNKVILAVNMVLIILFGHAEDDNGGKYTFILNCRGGIVEDGDEELDAFMLIFLFVRSKSGAAAGVEKAEETGRAGQYGIEQKRTT